MIPKMAIKAPTDTATTENEQEISKNESTQVTK